MKRMACLILLIVLTTLLAVSCRSTGNVESFTDEQYDYALHLVLDQAQSKATSDLFKQFNAFPFRTGSLSSASPMVLRCIVGE